jgi:hypothetical protein
VFLAGIGPAGARAGADVTGTWDLSVESPGGTAQPTMTLAQEGEKVTGTYHGRFGDASLEGTVKENEIRFAVKVKFRNDTIVVTYTGTVDGDSMQGVARFGDAETGKWSAHRRKKLD